MLICRSALCLKGGRKGGGGISISQGIAGCGIDLGVCVCGVLRCLCFETSASACACVCVLRHFCVCVYDVCMTCMYACACAVFYAAFVLIRLRYRSHVCFRESVCVSVRACGVCVCSCVL